MAVHAPDWEEPKTEAQEEARRGFWNRVRRELTGLSGGNGVNIAALAVDRHAAGPSRDRPAIRCLSRHGTVRELTFGDLREQSNRFANVLLALGLRKGQRVFTLAGRIPELYIAALGALKNRNVFCALFSAFGPEPICQRMEKGDCRLLVTTSALYQRKVAPIRERLPALQTILLTDAGEDVSDSVLSFPRRLAAASGEFTIPPTEPEDLALLHFTSGTTGAPKGALHAHDAALVHCLTGRKVLDLRPDDVFWCTADPGWVTGISYGLVSPLVNGVTNLAVEAEFDAELWYRILESEGVTVWYTAPTAIRRLMRMDFDPRRRFDLSRLRLIFSVGEPLNPEAVAWAERTLGMPIHDTWWQTETGGIMIANLPGVPIRPGSMGRPVPGVEAAIVRTLEGGEAEVMATPGVKGQLALRAGWPSMFRGYLHDEAIYRKCFAGDWYLTGDLAWRDEEGYYWFVGRSDDVIETSGHLVGPFEVESVLMEHPAVAAAGVIGKPDPLLGEMVKAFLSLKPGIAADARLRKEILAFARSRLGAALAPREMEFCDRLPETRSGKILRRLLKARELGLQEGDPSATEINPGTKPET